MEKSKVCYDEKSDYDYCLNRCVLRERFFIYSGKNKTEIHIQIFDLKLMEIITVIKADKNNFQFFNFNRNNKILFFSYFNYSSSFYTLKQYEMNKNGHLNQIGEIKYKGERLREIIMDGNLNNGNGDESITASEIQTAVATLICSCVEHIPEVGHHKNGKEQCQLIRSHSILF